MKATQQTQALLLDLVDLDIEAGRIRKRVNELTASDAAATMRDELLRLSVQVAEALHRVENLELEKTRAETDLKAVELRLKRDIELLNNTTSGKDAQGIQSEIASLKVRQSDLEDAELAILETLDAVKAELAKYQVAKTELEAEAAKAMELAASEIMKLQSSLTLLASKRQLLLERIPAEVQDLYAKKATRGVPVGKLMGRECGACRMSLTIGDFDHVQALAEDDLASCPECQAILVRF